MAPHLEGLAIRSRYISDQLADSAKAIVWVVEPDLDLVKRFHKTPQVLDVINPASENLPAFYQRCAAFSNLILNTESSRRYVGPEPDKPWKTWVIPHHHCNMDGYFLPAQRLARPTNVGYVGQPEHLHDTEAIQRHVESMGLRFINAATTNLKAYEQIDIGVAWTRPDTHRDETRSNIKATNFAAHGIPSVVCNYESYRAQNDSLGTPSVLVASTLKEFLEGITLLIEDEDARRSLVLSRETAFQRYHVRQIAADYARMLTEIRA